ncbi:MAG: Rrf2 family transcriptional regulator, partial [Brevundimonas sp.]
GERCITHHLWEDLGEEIHRYLSGVSLADVIAKRTSRRSADMAASDAVGVAA